MLCYTLFYSVILCFTLLYSIILCYTVLYWASWATGRNIKLKKRNRAPGENPLPVRKNYYQELGEPTFSNGKKELWLNDYQYTKLLHPRVPPKTRWTMSWEDITKLVPMQYLSLINDNLLLKISYFPNYGISSGFSGCLEETNVNIGSFKKIFWIFIFVI